MTDMHESVWNAINSLPKPCEKSGVLAAAQQTLNTNDYAQFKSWFDDNWSQLLNMVNKQ